jgi:chromosome segregation ATPase
MMSEVAFQEAVLTALTELKAEFDSFKAEVRADLGSLKAEVDSLKAEFGSLKIEFGSLKAEVRAEIGSLKAEIGSLKAEVASLKTEVATLTVRVERLERESFLHYTSLTKDLQQVKGDLHFFSLNSDTRLSALETSMSDITRILRMHENRLTALEARP